MADYESMSRQELVKLRADIDRAIAAVADRDKRAALKAAEAAAREHGFSLADLATAMGGGGGGGGGGGRGRAAAKEPSPPRFRNPDDATQTWSGRGRRPRWVNEAEKAGRAIEDMRIA